MGRPWLGDLFVLEEHRGKGLGVRLAQAAVAEADRLGLRVTLLATKDAHAMYERFGFGSLPQGRFMRRPGDLP